MDRPVIGIPCCNKTIPPHPYHVVGDKYVRAVSDGAGGLPWLIPLLGDSVPLEDYVDRLDGLMLTGSASNVEPWRYGDIPDDVGPGDPGMAIDPARDQITLPLIQLVLRRGLPLLAICRGIQELNVAMGGTLHRRLPEVAGRMSHALGDAHPVADQYAPSHEVTLTPGGHLEQLLGVRSLMVNSVHNQGIDRLALGLAAEATAPDGQIEAVTVAEARSFALGIQWHPEWRYWEDPHSTRLFAAFGEAAQAYAARRRASAAA